MTKRQSEAIARAFREAYQRNCPPVEDFMDKRIQHELEMLMIDVANEIITYSVVFDRDKFLKDCGHPQWNRCT